MFSLNTRRLPVFSHLSVKNSRTNFWVSGHCIPMCQKGHGWIWTFQVYMSYDMHVNDLDGIRFTAALTCINTYSRNRLQCMILLFPFLLSIPNKIIQLLLKFRYWHFLQKALYVRFVLSINFRRSSCSGWTSFISQIFIWRNTLHYSRSVQFSLRKAHV